MRNCPKCGSELSSDSRFCENCGTSIPLQAEPPIAVQEQPILIPERPVSHTTVWVLSILCLLLLAGGLVGGLAYGNYRANEAFHRGFAAHTCSYDYTAYNDGYAACQDSSHCVYCSGADLCCPADYPYYYNQHCYQSKTSYAETCTGP